MGLKKTCACLRRGEAEPTCIKTSTRLTINMEEIGLRSGLAIRRKSGGILAEPEDFQTDDKTMAMKMIINGKSDLLLMPGSLTGVLLKR